ncbi:MAG: ArsR family transcriptional regulator [Saprospiraceae bacterium]|nr:ArsR family transcriptional regulator [Saprospiraceae bacterium]
MLETLISSKTRIKLLLKFFLNSKATSYLRGLESEFGDSTNSIRIELNRFEKAGMLTSFQQGNKKYFRANIEHPLYKETHNILLKYIGFDKIIDRVVEKLGEVKRVYVTGAFAQGLDDKIIELVFIGELNQEYLKDLIEKVESHITRNIKYEVLSENDFSYDNWDKEYGNSLLLWEA